MNQCRFPSNPPLFESYKMGNTALLVIIIALVLYRWFPITDDRLLILMESKTDDPSKLKEIHGIISAFKIEHSLDNYWQHVHTQNEQKVLE